MDRCVFGSRSGFSLMVVMALMLTFVSLYPFVYFQTDDGLKRLVQITNHSQIFWAANGANQRAQAEAASRTYSLPPTMVAFTQVSTFTLSPGDFRMATFTIQIWLEVSPNPARADEWQATQTVALLQNGLTTEFASAPLGQVATYVTPRLTFEVSGTNQIIATFSREMGPGILNPLNFTVSGPGKGTWGDNPVSVSIIGDPADPLASHTYLLTFSGGNAPNEQIILTINNVGDSLGNTVVIVYGTYSPEGPSPATTITYNFSNAGATGRSGPSQAQVDLAYSGTTLAGQVTVSSGIQRWTVPTTGRYLIKAVGAGGGPSNFGSGGRGQCLFGEFDLAAGTVLNIVVGQAGQSNGKLGTYNGGSGGGGTFVYTGSIGGAGLLMAAGGGGGALSTSYNVVSGNINDANSGEGGYTITDRSGNVALGGTGGNGGGFSNRRDYPGGLTAGPGSGWVSDYNPTYGVTKTLGGTRFLGGIPTLNGREGGFGGGGASGNNGGDRADWIWAGGGGGYSGGGAGHNGGVGDGQVGGGGGSFNSGINKSSALAAEGGPGWVTITFGTPSPIDSVLISAQQKSIINGWIGNPNLNWRLLYRRSTDGGGASNFHARCDGQGPTVVLVKLNNGKLIGGYASVSWSSSGGYSGNSSCFLFSLTNSFKHYFFQFSYYLYFYPSYGPTFGGGHDLHINSTMNKGYANIGFSFLPRIGSYGSSEARNDFAGSYDSWTITELEVWAVD